MLSDAGGDSFLQEVAERCTSGRPRIIVMASLGTRLLESTLYDAALLKPVKRTELFQCLTGTGEAGTTRDSNPQTGRDRPCAVAGRVLLVDDNPMNLQVAKAMLERLEITVDTATGGEEALARLGENIYRAVLMDEQMPGMDGLEATRRIRQRSGDDREVPVIALTANADSQSEQRCLDAGMNGFLSKPVRRKQLRTVLGRWLPELLEQAGVQVPDADIRPS